MESLYLKGFKGQENEITKKEFPVLGNIPEWLNGNLYRMGPGKFKYGETQVNHIFDGPGMVHHFNFEKGKVYYQNKFLRTNVYKESLQLGKLTHQEYSTDYRSGFQKLMGLFGKRPKISDNANVNVLRVKNDLLAITSSPSNVHFDAQTLNTYGKYKFDDDFEFYGTPHPSLDPETGDVWDIAEVISGKPEYIFYKIPFGKSKREIVAKVPTKKLGYMHSFATTENYIIMIEFPYFLNILKLGVLQKTFSESLDWEPTKGVNYIIVNKHTGAVNKIHSNDVFTFYHIANSFEKDEKIIIDMPIFSEPNEKDLAFKNVTEKGQSLDKYLGFYRFSIHQKTNTISREKLSDNFIELERINYENNNDKDYQFTYGMSQLPSSNFFDRLIKVDVKNKVDLFWHEKNTVPGEPVFVPTPNGSSEDDGVILSVILDGETEHSVLMILDAKTMAKIASVPLSQHIPFGFHGQFYFTK
jgi:beta,beta-carotene 9',10'-dioxygenase